MLEFIQNPDNTWILYSVAAFFFIDGLFLKLAANKVLTQKIGEIVGGDHKEQQATSKSAQKLILASAYLTMFFGIVLAVLAFLMSRAIAA